MLKTTISAKNFSALVDMAKDAQISISGGDDKTVKRSPPSKKSNKAIKYFTFLHFNARSVSIKDKSS